MYSTKILHEIISYIHKHLEYYSKIQKKDISNYTIFIESINKKNNLQLSLEKMIDLRDVYIYFLANSKGIIASRYGNDIFNDYTKGLNILDIANKYNLPPISVLYQVLIEKQYEYHQIKELLADIDKLPIDLKNQMSIINKYNPSYWLNFDKLCQTLHLWICSKSQVIKKIKTITDIPFNYHTNDLPSIIFDTVVTYKNLSFKWIIIKKHIIFNHPLIEKYIHKLIKKYNHLGQGLLIFTDIYCSKKFIQQFNIPIVDYSFLN